MTDKNKKADGESKKKVQESEDKKSVCKKSAKVPYEVAPRTSIPCKRGVVDAGEEVRAEYFSGGAATLKELVKQGRVIEN